jgi:hypothetical protein
MNAFFSFGARALVISATLAAASLGGCNFGGLNDNVKTPGDQPGGVKISLGDIAVSPDGSYFLFEREDQLAVGWVATGQVELLPVTSPARLAFSHQRHLAYVTTETGKLHAVDIEARQLEWSANTGKLSDPMVVASKDDSRVAVGGDLTVVLFAADDGSKVASQALGNLLVDIEILPDDARLLAVERHRWPAEAEEPTTAIHVVSLANGATHAIEVPNCSDDIIVPKHGEMALLAPTFCGKDPISYIDLTPGDEKFVRNLPGFGPVAMGPDGSTAVGFLDMTQVDASLFDDPAQIPAETPRFHLMVIDTATLAYEFHPYGDHLPRYAMTPDGSVLLVDHAQAVQAHLFDLSTKEYRAITGGLTLFDQLAFSSDSAHAYVLSDAIYHVESKSSEAWTDYQLFDLEIASAAAQKLPTPFRPRNVNVSPDDERLFLRRDATTICIYSLATRSCERELVLATK